MKYNNRTVYQYIMHMAALLLIIYIVLFYCYVQLPSVDMYVHIQVNRAGKVATYIAVCQLKVLSDVHEYKM